MSLSFVFQNVLDIRHNKVESIEIQLGGLQKRLLFLEEQKENLEQAKAQCLVEMSLRMKGDLDMAQLDLLRTNITALDERTNKVKAEITSMENKIAQVRKNLVQAKQDEETLEILKRKEIEKYNAEIKRIEGIQQDDVYISLAFKNQQQGVQDRG